MSTPVVRSPEAMVLQFAFTAKVLAGNTAGFTQEDSLYQPPAGNCLNWIAGHLVATRNAILALLGEAPIWPENVAARYQRNSAAITGPGESVLPFEKILADYQASQVIILDGLPRLTPDVLASKAPFTVVGLDTYGAIIAGLAFHESYHVGQTGLLRRMIGKESVLKA